MGELGIREHITHPLRSCGQKQSCFSPRMGQLAPGAHAGYGFLALVWALQGELCAVIFK